MNQIMFSINRVYANREAPDSLRRGRRTYSFSQRLPVRRLVSITYDSISRFKYKGAIISRKRSLPQRIPRISVQHRIGRLARILGVGIPKRK